ncbi:MAG TPA: hypothetical protein VN653_17925, partial [Anaerolineales bacterium]|nr:hypothetical protein [Anaerolineales bacterium]
ALESLAPFGAGNPSLKLATRDARLKSVSTIGKAKEHLRLTVEDESGNSQNILWWGGTGEELPETGAIFDIAYSLRASSFRGQKQVSLQFEEFRVVEEKPIEVKPEKIEVVDYRLQAGTLESLKVETLIWAEGADKARGKNRFELQRADELAIYTAPPSPAELRSALEIVKPKKVHVLGIAPRPEKPDEFLARLAGMTKYAINNKDGKVSIKELAAATAQRESVIRIGLEWLAAGGHVTVSGEADAVLLSIGNGEVNQYIQKELYTAVKGILEETAAYREYFSRAALDGLIS